MGAFSFWRALMTDTASAVIEELQRSFDTLGHARNRLITALTRAGAPHDKLAELEAMLLVAHTSYGMALKKAAECMR